MSMTFRIISGVAGLIILVSTVVLALNLLTRELEASVYLAGYLGIGCIMLGAYLLFYAIAGEWRPNLIQRRKKR